MLVVDFIEQLKNGELFNNGMFTQDDSVVTKRLLSLINLGIMDLGTRFDIHIRSVELHTNERLHVYQLLNQYVVTNPILIDDTHYLFASHDASNLQEILLRVLYMRDLSTGEVINYNNITGADSVAFVSYNKIRFYDLSMLGGVYRLDFRARPMSVSTSASIIDLPPQFIPALALFVAYKVHSAGTNQEHMNCAEIYYQRYISLCDELRNTGLAATAVTL